MFYRSDILSKELYKPGEVGKLLGISNQTVIKYCNLGIIDYFRNQYNHRRISNEQLCNYLEKQGLLIDDSNEGKHDIIYARVSTHKQAKRGDLDRQIEKIKLFAIEHNVSNLLIKKDVASGLNDNRKQLLSLLSMIQKNKVRRIFILYKDRLTRFGFNYIKTICDFHHVEIIIVSEEENSKTQSEELAGDIVALIHSFSGKLYGLRKKIKERISDNDNDNDNEKET